MTKENSTEFAVYAAIGMALYEQENEVHDREANIVTIRRKIIAYSPWNSKFLLMSHAPSVQLTTKNKL